MPKPPRYVPHRELPPYSYVPGLHPHPISDPRGHMHGHEESDVDQAGAIAFGFDLFNHGYYWEAHEAWEQAWVSAGRKGELADILKGLIKLAAAGVKAREGKAEGVRRHARRAEELFANGRVTNSFCGDWAKHAADIAVSADQLLNQSSESVVVVFGFCLELAMSFRNSFIDTNSE